MTVMAFALATQVWLPVTEYICRYTGHRMAACCCGAEENQGDAPAVTSACCCDVRVSLSSAERRVTEAKASLASAPTALTVLSPMPLHAGIYGPAVLSALAPAFVERPPDRGRDLYLLVHRLLI
jgi:hypothetical protein